MPLLGAKTHKTIADLTPPKAFHRMIFFWFLTIGIVMFEPAPFDVLFLPIAAWALTIQKLPRALTPGILCFLSLAYIVTNFLSLIGVDSQDRSIAFMLVTIYMLSLSGLVALLVYNYSHRLVGTIMSGYVVIALASAAIGIAGTLSLLPGDLNELVTLHGGRAKAFFKDPNVYSPFLLLAFVYLLDKFTVSKNNKLGLFCLLSLLSAGILVSFSRAAWISTFFSVGAYLILRAISEGRFKKLLSYFMYFLVFSLTLGGLLTLFIHRTNLVDFLKQRTMLQPYDITRFQVQELAVYAGLENLFGIGPGQSEIMFASYEAIGSGAAQSIFVRVLCEQGIFGAVFFGLLLILTGLKSIKLCVIGDPANRGLHCVFSSAYFSMLLCAIVIDTLHWRHFFLIIGVIWGLSSWQALQTDKKRSLI